MSMIGPSAILAALISASMDFDHGISESSATTDTMLADMVAMPSSVRFYAWSLKIIPMADDHVFFIPRRVRLSICERTITLPIIDPDRIEVFISFSMREWG